MCFEFCQDGGQTACCYHFQGKGLGSSNFSHKLQDSKLKDYLWKRESSLKKDEVARAAGQYFPLDDRDSLTDSITL